MDEKIISLLSIFKENGFEGRIVGGYVRDMILGNESTDVDVATDAMPDDVIRIFQKHNAKIIETGIKHGTVTVILNGFSAEITTLRRDDVTDGRHAQVSFSDDFKEDAKRRDFTINAIYMDLDGKIYDYFNGINDLHVKNLRFIGNPRDRILEDYLRILRFFRFAAKLDFDISREIKILDCIKDMSPNLQKISKERIRSEIFKILESRKSLRILKIMHDVGVLHFCFENNFGSAYEYISNVFERDENLMDAFFDALTPVAKLFLITDRYVLDFDKKFLKINDNVGRFGNIQKNFKGIDDIICINSYENNLKISEKNLKKNNIAENLFDHPFEVKIFEILRSYKKKLHDDGSRKIFDQLVFTHHEKKSFLKMSRNFVFEILSPYDILKNLLFADFDENLLQKIYIYIFLCNRNELLKKKFFDYENLKDMYYFPIKASDLISFGVENVKISDILSILKYMWSDSLGVLTKDDLMKQLEQIKNVI